MLKLGWFSSGGEGSRYLLEQVLMLKPNDVEIKWVFMNKDVDEDENVRKFQLLCRQAGIPNFSYSWKKFKEKKYVTGSLDFKRKLYDSEVAEMLDFYITPDHSRLNEVDYIFMVGYMRIITKSLINQAIFINLHPGLPDGYKGTYHEVIEKLKRDAKGGAITTGSMTHYVDEGVDTGRPIMFFRFTCPAEYDIIRSMTLAREPYLLLETINHLNFPVDKTDDINYHLTSNDYKKICEKNRIE
jgi:folate-dependent phosphoribosylglycinamide formyltransferase PurN